MADFLSKRFGYPLYFSFFWQALTCPDTTRVAREKAGNRRFAPQMLAAKQYMECSELPEESS
ncbi:hypothetical protein [Sinorhizobium glycinis]|uniref:hypothetical protein n=1 Tax=Sinorhizobium glycinis TaxID=1472378 RepID=UPI0012E83431|nr:hypothetical protein [Sinorhizobium glycinis]